VHEDNLSIEQEVCNNLSVFITEVKLIRTPNIGMKSDNFMYEMFNMRRDFPREWISNYLR
jgi:hypothetical protein